MIIDTIVSTIGVISLALGLIGFWFWLQQIEQKINEINNKLDKILIKSKSAKKGRSE